VSKALAICPSLINRKMVMLKFLDNPKIKISTPDYVLLIRLAIAQKQIMEERVNLWKKLSRLIPMPNWLQNMLLFLLLLVQGQLLL
jgi:hypothetical protein